MELPEQQSSTLASVAESLEAWPTMKATVTATATAAASALAAGGDAPDRASIALAVDAHAPMGRELPPDLPDDIDEPDGELTFTLLLQGDDLDPDDVSRRLGCAPSASHRKGETWRPWPSPPGRPPPPPRATGAWLLEVGCDSTSRIDELIETLLGPLPSEPAFWQALHRDFTVLLHLSAHTARCGTAFRLDTAALARCTATGAPLHIHLHLYDRADA